MVLATAGIFIAAGVVLRIAIRTRAVRTALWLLPILIVLSGALLIFLRLAVFPEMPHLYSLVRFLFLSFLLIAMGYPIARLLLPSQAQLTRGGVPPLIRGLLVAVIAFVGMFVLLSWSFPTLSLTPVFVTSGALSIVLALAVQDLLANLLAGIVLSFEKPFKVGDWVHVGDQEGEVSHISWRATRIRTRQNDYVWIPNTVSTKQKLTNYSQPSSLHMLKIHVGVTYETPCALAAAALEEAAAHTQDVLKSPQPEAHFHDYADSSLVYELRVWIDNYESAPAVESDVRKQIWYSFKRHGITIPFPQRDVHFYPAEKESPQCYARLYVSDGPLSGALFELGEEPLTIGRTPESRICISDPHVSTEHAVIEWVNGECVLRDMGSRHGTYLNGETVTTAALRQGDSVKIGPITLVFEHNLAAEGMRSLAAHFRRKKAPPVDTEEASTETAV